MKAVGQAALCSFPCKLLWQMKNQLEESCSPPCMDYDVEAILFMGSESRLYCLGGVNLSLPPYGFYRHFHLLGDVPWRRHSLFSPSFSWLLLFACQTGSLLPYSLISWFLLSYSLPQRWVRTVANRPGRVWFLSLAGGACSVQPQAQAVFLIPTFLLIKLIL